MSNNTIEITERCIGWIKKWFDEQSDGAKGIVIGMSGGKDSTVACKLCAEAIGRERVLGVLLPNITQDDFAIKACNQIGVEYKTLNIAESANSLMNEIFDVFGNIKRESEINVLPRIRMTFLYAIAQNLSYRVCGTCNYSEYFIGYSTKWGDSACDFNPIANLTCSDVIAIGDELGLPYELVHKIPDDGLCGETDEERFGFSYDTLDKYISGGQIDREDECKIESMVRKASHKKNIIQVPSFLVTH